MLSEASPPSTAPAGDRPANPRQILSPRALSDYNARSNRQGLRHLAGHLAILTASGALWATQFNQNWWLALPAGMVCGFSFAAMFAVVHESIHRTAFASQRLNDSVAWLAGLLSLYNSTFYRRYHNWHHRYTQLPGKDPELEDPKPTSWGDYLWQLSGLPWWWGRLRSHGKLALGRVQDYPYLNETAQSEAVRSTRWQLAVYAIAFTLTAALGHPAALLLYWLLPLALGQPILRLVLLSEHAGCSYDDNLLTNTRTTLTLWPLRFLMWNMPFHAEHHLYPSIPFHALPAVHQELKAHWQHLEPGYLKVQGDLLATLKTGTL